MTLGESHTPLVKSVGIARKLGASGLNFKLESCNPSGSYKDRFVRGEIRSLLERGCRACIATSSGNTGSALAAWCARYEIGCLLVANDNAPPAKLVQMQAHGAVIFRVPGFVSSPDITRSTFEILQSFAEATDTPLIVSAYRYCPTGMVSVESISSELVTALPDARHVFVPVGGGGLYSAIVRGFLGVASRPLIHAVQPVGCPTLLRAFQSGADSVDSIESTTAISGLSVPFDIDGSLALQLLRQNGGLAIGVTDEEVFTAQRLLLRSEGIYAEPAGATALAGYLKALTNEQIRPSEPAVCLVTGHGFKDSNSAMRIAGEAVSETVRVEQLRSKLVDFAETCR